MGQSSTRQRSHDRGGTSAIQKSETSLKALAEHYDINPKTVVKWKRRRFVGNTPMGSKVVRSSVLSIE